MDSVPASARNKPKSQTAQIAVKARVGMRGGTILIFPGHRQAACQEGMSGERRKVGNVGIVPSPARALSQPRELPYIISEA
jgi:hypothetical protein